MNLSLRLNLFFISFCILYLHINGHAQTPTTTRNSVMEQMPRDAMTTLSGSTYQTVQSKINYFDGLGRPIQSLIYRGSGDGLKDILVSTPKYDSYGRASKNIITVASATGTGEFSADAETLAKAFYIDQKPFTEIKDFDTSPLNRVQKSYGVGEAWQNANKYMETKYEIEGNGIQLYTVNSNNDGASTSGTYPESSLIKTVMVNEQGNQVIEIKDLAGKVIQKTVVKGSEYLSVKFIYDDMERLRYVLPPLINKNFSDNNKTTFIESEIEFIEGIYAYKYDERGRITEKHIAGAGWTRYIYDKYDRLILQNSDKDAAASPNYYLFKKYDIFGREIANGLLFGIGNTSRTTLQAAFDNVSLPYEERTTLTGVGFLGYTNRSFPSGFAYDINESNYRAITYYDDYVWQTESTFNFQSASAFHPQQTTVNGIITGILERNLETNSWYKTVNYYDFKFRVIQSRSLNHKGNIETGDYKFRFNGELLKMRMEHQGIIELNEYENDNIGRKVKYKHSKNGISQNVCSYNFDQIGRLSQKSYSPSYTISSKQSGTWSDDNIWTLGSLPTQRDLVNIKVGHTVNIPANFTAFANILKDDGTLTYQAPNSVLSFGSGSTTALQILDFKYHIRGGLTGINLDANNNLTSNRLFSFRLSYENDGSYYDGNIRKQEWRSSVDNITRSYTYSYDESLRLISALYEGGMPNETYSLENMTYDYNGNIKTLWRKGSIGTNSFGYIDQLTYTYSANSNKLNTVGDAITGNTHTGDFRDGNTTGNDYDYWEDGSLKKDMNKGISEIQYNYLKLPKRIDFTNGKWLEYQYSSGGKKLKKTTSENKVTDYLGNLIYENDVLYQIAHDEGRIVNGTYEYNYYDHLGNLRLAFKDSAGIAKITQAQDFDPFGVENWTSKYVNNSKISNFKFNGIEKDVSTGFYEAKYRSFDGTIGKWTSIDPKPDYAISSFASMKNNPISYTDPMGDTTVVNNYGVILNQYGNDNLIFQQGRKGALTQIGELGKSIDLSNILPNILKRNKNVAKSLSSLAVASNTSTALLFANLVRPGGLWDYKNTEVQKGNLFGAAASYEDITKKKTSFSSGKLNFLEGASDIGNYNYGYTGRYVGGEGYSHSVLWAAGGALQIGKDFIKLQWGKAFNESTSIFPFPYPPYGDENDDFIWSTLGMKQADNEKKGNK